MTASINIKDFNSYNKLQAGMATRTFRFSWTEIFTSQAQIVALWRSLLSENLHPVAHTFLGRIVSITVHP